MSEKIARMQKNENNYEKVFWIYSGGGIDYFNYYWSSRSDDNPKSSAKIYKIVFKGLLFFDSFYI